MKQLLIFILCLSFTTVVTLATTKTLPKGVIKADIYQNNFSIETLGANPSGDRVTWTEVSLTEGKMSDIFLLQHIANTELVTLDLTTKLANSWKKRVTHLDLAYGLTDMFTIFANISYEEAVLDYTDAYYAQSEKINGVIDATYNRVPQQATADNLNDTFVGFKFSPGPFAVVYKTTNGDLMTGHDSLEKQQADLVQELETSRGYSQHHVYLFNDLNLMGQKLELTTGYIALGKLTQDFLDIQKCDILPGDMIIAKANAPISLRQFTLNPSYTMIYHRPDFIKGGNSAFSNTNVSPLTKAYSDWTVIPHSSGYVQLATVELIYQPTIFLRTFVRGSVVLSNDATGQFYNFPGRIEPGNMILFGVTLFAKNPFISGGSAINDEY
ncbi:hypothetical protein CL658_01775 [bacterium]|nr:hypothetical protein [bacterium]